MTPELEPETPPKPEVQIKEVEEEEDTMLSISKGDSLFI
jgi:hypothetical protein